MIIIMKILGIRLYNRFFLLTIIISSICQIIIVTLQIGHFNELELFMLQGKDTEKKIIKEFRYL